MKLRGQTPRRVDATWLSYLTMGQFHATFLSKDVIQVLGSLRWPNTVYARFTDSVSDAIKRALGLWYVNTAVDKVIPQFHMKWIIKVSFDPK